TPERFAQEKGITGCRPTHRTCKPPVHVNPGPPGTTPPPRTELIPVASGGAGRDPQVGRGTWADLARFLTPSHNGRMLLACERDYVNGRFDDALTRLVWLKAVLDAALAGNQQDGVQHGSAADAATPAIYIIPAGPLGSEDPAGSAERFKAQRDKVDA